MHRLVLRPRRPLSRTVSHHTSRVHANVLGLSQLSQPPRYRQVNRALRFITLGNELEFDVFAVSGYRDPNGAAKLEEVQAVLPEVLLAKVVVT